MSEPALKIIAFCGPKTCGKDSAAKALFDANFFQCRYLYRRAPFAEGVKNICKEMFGYTTEQMEDSVLKETKTDTWPFIEPRWPMMDIANWLRDKYGGDVHVQRWLNHTHQAQLNASMMSDNLVHVITDLRFPEEVEMIQKHEGCIIYIHREEAEDNLAKARAASDAMAQNPSESHYKMLWLSATHVIFNDSTLEALHKNVSDTVSKFLTVGE